ncbi:MAG: LptF/LptG family permease [Bacteroidetes bacterium]|nr:LptF/LptG family permease [Bacteroidota bacterium]
MAVVSFYFNGWVIPHSRDKQLSFENQYIKSPYKFSSRNIHRQIKPGEYIYFESYDNKTNNGYLFSLEKFENQKLVYKMLADRISWDSTQQKWSIETYTIRHINGMQERLESGARLDTALNFNPREFSRRINFIEAMDQNEITRFIADEKLRGSELIPFYEVEKYKRISYPFATFILTIIGVSLSSRKVRGGTRFAIRSRYSFNFLNEFDQMFSKKVEFRIAETPVFVDKRLKQKLIDAGEQILKCVLTENYLKQSDKGIPQNLFAPTNPTARRYWQLTLRFAKMIRVSLPRS